VEPEGSVTRPNDGGKPAGWFHRLFGIDDQFSRADRWITLGIFWWSIAWFLVFVIGSVAYLIHPWSAAVWANYWFVQAICLPLVIGVVTTVWFTIGCFRDMRVFFRRLREETVNLHDDGTVAHGDHAPDLTVTDGESATEQCRAKREETM